MATVSCDGCRYIGPQGPPGQRGETGPKGDPAVSLPVSVGMATKFNGLMAMGPDGLFREVKWDDVLIHLLKKIGLQPGDRLVVKRCNGSVEELPLDALNAECASSVHDT